MSEDRVPEIESPVWSGRTKRTMAILLVVVLGILAWRLSAIWPPLIISLVLAYLLSPVVSFFARLLPFGSPGFRRTFSTTLTFFLALTVVVVSVLVLVPAIFAQLEQFGEGIPVLIDEMRGEVERLLSSPIVIGDQTIVPLDVLQEMTGASPGQPIEGGAWFDLAGLVQTLVAPLAQPILGAVGSAFSGILTLIFVLVMVFYFMKDGPRFIEIARLSVPEPYRQDYRYLMYQLGQVWNAYLRGQALLCLIMGGAGFFAALVLGLPSPLALGLVNGVLEFIPNIGPTLATIPAALFALFFSSTTIPGLQGVVFMLVVIATWSVLQNLEAVVIVPRVMGSNLDLHPVVVVVAVIGGAGVAGALGIILAAPMVATLRVLGEYLYIKLFDVPLPTMDQQAAAPGQGLLQRSLGFVVRLLGRRPVSTPTTAQAASSHEDSR